MKKSIISFIYPHWNTLLDDSCSMALHVIGSKLCHLLQGRKDFLTLINCVWSNMSFGKSIIAIIRKGGYKTVEIYHKWPTRTGRKYTTYGKRKVLFHSDLNFRVSIPLKPTQIFFFSKKIERKTRSFCTGSTYFWESPRARNRAQFITRSGVSGIKQVVHWSSVYRRGVGWGW